MVLARYSYERRIRSDLVSSDRMIYELDTPITKEWYIGVQRLHRCYGPACVHQHPSGGVSIGYNRDGVSHRVEGPADIKTGFNRWDYFGRAHRVEGPAMIWFDPNREINGNSTTINWYVVHGIDVFQVYDQII